MAGPIDIGHGHRIYPYVEGDVLVGIIDEHRTADGRRCRGAVAFRGYGDGRPEWDVTGQPGDPDFTLSPSVLCTCGEHGWIRNGQWVEA